MLPVILTTPEPLGERVISIFVSPPVAERTGPLVVVAFARVNSLTALLVAVTKSNSLPLES